MSITGYDVDLSPTKSFGRATHITTFRPTLDGSLSAEDVRAHITKEVEFCRATVRGIQEQISELNFIYNRVARVNTLPPELLSMIFGFAEANSPKSTALIHITHVCRHWRDVALRTPALWSRVALNHPEGVKAFLARSQALPLEVSLVTPELPLVATTRLLSPQIARMRTLDVNIPPGASLRMVYEVLKLPAPMLEAISIRKQPVPANAPPGHATDLVVDPVPHDGAPMLRSLKLFRVPLPFLPQGPSMLTSIELDVVPMSPKLLLNLLEHAPLLERFKMSGMFARARAVDMRKITLTQLQSLYLCILPLRAIPLLLSNLVLPPMTNITLNSHIEHGSDFSHLMPAYDADSLPFMFKHGLRRLEVIWNFREECLRAYQGPSDFHSPALEISALLGPGADRGPIAGFFGGWPFDTSQIECLVVCGDGGIDLAPNTLHMMVPRERWAAMLNSLPSLKTLRIMSVSGVMNLADELAAERPQMLCPQLEAFEFFDIQPDPRFHAVFKDIVLQRSPEGAGCLKRVELFNVGPDKWPRADVVGLLRMEQAGVKVILDESESDQIDDPV